MQKMWNRGKADVHLGQECIVACGGWTNSSLVVGISSVICWQNGLDEKWRIIVWIELECSVCEQGVGLCCEYYASNNWMGL